MTVYVLTLGAYAQSGVAGVYSSPEAAMEQYPYGQWTGPDKAGRYFNSDGDTAQVDPFELDDGTPEAE